jgi:hypothetical protein
VIELNTYQRIVVFAATVLAVHAEWGDGRLNSREALDWRRSG